MNKEDILKLAQESYEQGQSDLMKSCEEAVVKAIEVAIAAEREKFCAVLRQLHDSYLLASRSNNIRAKGETK